MAPPDPTALVRLLSGWLPRQRWFGGKDRPIGALSIAAATELLPGPDPSLHHLVVDVRQGAVASRYQLLLGVRADLPAHLRPGEIGPVAPAGPDCRGPAGPALHAYDAAYDPELTRPLLAHMAAGAEVGPLRFRRAPNRTIETGLSAVPMSAEQSNTSLVFGDAYICKLFRRLTPGVSPDLEVSFALSEAHCAHVPAVHGWIEMETGEAGGPVTLALLSEYLRTATDGWQLALTSVRDWFASPAHTGDGHRGGPHSGGPYSGTGGEAFTGADAGAAGGDFAAEAGRLGAATATVHHDLAKAFGVTRVPAADVRAMARGMRRQLDEVGGAVPELRPYVPAIGAAFEEVEAGAEDLLFQRVHGDYHLGQVLRTGTGWVLLDFEGEPARTPAERRAPSHPLRDVAGMLRSFEYAARFMLAGNGDLPPDAERDLEARARAWTARNRAAFRGGYAAAGGPDPAGHAALLRAFELDKAVYEIRYEARNRPSWLPVPLRSLADLVR
ncbi:MULTISPECIES: maltokinase N-terminal cap-like domain-containing protein [Actinomadura]|uniref:Maltokinase n=1 Tax=Actinomadura yumaensis TaxID=111807 RepID=A0ABW2CCQ4_9ACTN|nr:aminoglycoside phosphotransferase [Actinomadura sp. J1-007]MWK33510.1 aminoglycoside phosphotransferase [Actinomadura sp. J1-007]